MANPNIVNVTSILGENASVSLTSTGATSIVSNASASGKVLKINTLIVSNVDGTNACDITINKYSAAALGGSAFAIASTVSVPADASLIVIDKTTAIYLKEDESIGATAGTANDLIVTCSWEEIS
jgi:hypothetical protein